MNFSVHTQKLGKKTEAHERLYSVKEVSKASGVSIRTLHLYDTMGLLKPLTRTEARYRLYGEQELLRLQQILFYKTLDFSLHEIKEILDAPDFDIVQALEQHKKALIVRQKQMETLLTTIDKTIHYLTQGEQNMEHTMTTDELYEGLPKEFSTTYRDEAQQRWREGVKRSENALRTMKKSDFQQLKIQFKENWMALSSMLSQDPTSDEVQKRIKLHYTLTRTFWGTVNSPDSQAEQFKGLGQMYLDDPRFTTIDGKPNMMFADFLHKAMSYFVDSTLG